MDPKSKRAILFLNLGGPEDLSEVRPFLFRLFSDPEIIRIRFSPLRRLVAWLISTARYKESQALYKKIGGGSPIRRLTDRQAAATQTLLEKSGRVAEIRTAFNCSKPLVEDVIEDLADRGFKHILAFPLYPQYSLSTTKGALDRTRDAVRKISPKIRLFEIKAWPTHPLFLKAHAELLRETARGFSSQRDQDTHLIFSAHSIPEKLVTELGDPYREQMEQTVKGVIEAAQWKGPWTLAWQSKLGPVKWLEPSTNEVVRGLGKKGVKQVLVTPIAFVTDHVETLYELDEEMAEAAEEAGVEQFLRVPGLNDHPTFIAALADIASAQKQFWD